MPMLSFAPGRRFGRLVSTYAVGSYTRCRCDCGAECTIRNDRLNSGKTRSCGCLRQDLRAAAKKPPVPPSPRGARPPELKALAAVRSAMMNRCYNSNDKNYARYGGRGILVDPAWHTLGGFLFEMQPTYKKGRWLERVDNDKGYSFDNCRWATPAQQAKNRHNTILFPHGVSLASWCRHHGIQYSQAYARFMKLQATLGRPPHAAEMLAECTR